MNSASCRLMLLPVLLGISDAVATLRCQPPEYWNGYGFDHLIEANPIARLALGLHPILLVPGLAAWFGVIWVLTFRTPAWVGLRCHVIAILGPLVGLSGAALRFSENPAPRLVLLLAVSLPAAVVLMRPFLGQWNGQSRIGTPGA